MWKDPALCHFLPFWMRIWRDPVLVITVRNPYDVATSWRQFTSFAGVETDVEVNLLRWQHTMITVLRETDTSQDRLFVSYEDLMTDPDRQGARLAEYLDAAVGRGALGRVDVMREACDPSLWHNRVRDTGAGASALSDAQTRLYSQLLAMTQRPDTPLHADFPLPPEWRTHVMGQEAAGHTHT
jgi:hypothetical protein